MFNMEFDSILKKRFSVREFKKKSVDWRRVIDIIESVNQNPFAGNINNIKYLIIEDKKTIKKISLNCQQSWISESPILVALCSDDTLLEKMYGERGRVYNRQQAGAATMTFILKAQDLGIGSCWIGAYHDDLIKEYLKIPQHIQIESIIALGYSSTPVKKTEKQKKKSIESSIAWEKWNQDRRGPFFTEQKDKYQLGN